MRSKSKTQKTIEVSVSPTGAITIEAVHTPIGIDIGASSVTVRQHGVHSVAHATDGGTAQIP